MSKELEIERNSQPIPTLETPMTISPSIGFIRNQFYFPIEWIEIAVDHFPDDWEEVLLYLIMLSYDTTKNNCPKPIFGDEQFPWIDFSPILEMNADFPLIEKMVEAGLLKNKSGE